MIEKWDGKMTWLRNIAIVLCSLGVLGLMEWGARRYLSVYDINYKLLREPWQDLHGMSQPVQWLILGDSSGKYSVSPAAFEKAFTGAAWNLCSVRSRSLLENLLMLEFYMGKFGAPKNLVICRAPDSWFTGYSEEGLLKIPLRVDEWNRLDSPSPVSLSGFLPHFLNRYLVLYGESAFLKKIILSPWNRPVQHYHSGQGQLIAMTHDPTIFDSHFKTQVDNDLLEKTEVNEVCLKKIADLAAQGHTNVYLCMGPIYDGLLPLPQYSSQYPLVQQRLARFSKINPYVHYIPPGPVMPKSFFHSLHHLLKPNSDIFSERLTTEISALRSQKTKGAL